MKLHRFAKAAQVTAILGFTLPWVTVSCGEQPVARLSGLDLATGTGTYRDPINGILKDLASEPSWTLVIALVLLAGSLFLACFLRRRASNGTSAFASGGALLCVAYFALSADADRLQSSNPIEAYFAGKISTEVQWGLWITGLSLAIATVLNALANRTDDDLERHPPLTLRLVASVALAALVTTPFWQVEESSAIAASPEQMTELTAQPKRGAPALIINALDESDRNQVGASCWAVDNADRVVFASDGLGVIRINGKAVQLTERDGEIGGNVLASQNGETVVTFQKRGDVKAVGEEAWATPMTMTVLISDGEVSIDVQRYCGA